ncbi:PAS domain-containing hybrid sensor histidine kinase/response regulator [Pelagicoccus albus]|uniref:histidine kinase n=1 Tax=Pelagicoccus albus TaxID=415222 RepID=A0A7X1E941_9BACT|nr:PAS domain S-box protein [Pelagicoccus albus]MBC2605407.1 PAS domain S-box protein [Pelagicoccus albus]
MSESEHGTANEQTTEKVYPKLQIELGNAIARLESDTEAPVFTVNENLEIIDLRNGARRVLDSPRSPRFPITACNSLSREQRAKLSHQLRSLLKSSESSGPIFSRIETDSDGEKQAFCLTLERLDLSEGSVAIRCVAETITPRLASPTKTPDNATPTTESIGWTLDTNTKQFSYFEDNPLRDRHSETLEEWLECVIESDRHRVKEAFNNLAANAQVQARVRYRISLPNGKEISVKTVARRNPSSGGRESNLLVGMHSLQTESQNKMGDLNLFAHLARKVRLAIVVCDKNGYISWCNDAFSESTGYSLAESIGRDPNSMLRGTLTETDTLKYIRDRMSKGKAFHAEIIQYKKGGVPFWVSIDGTALLDENGQTTRYISFLTDITESKKTQSAILRNEIKFRSLFDNSVDALLLLSPRDGVIIEANSSAIQLLDSGRLVGQRLDDIFPDNPKFRLGRLNDLVDRSEGGRSERGEFATARGEIRPVELTVSRTPIGESMALFVTLRDISEKHLLEEQLRHAQRMEAVGRLAGGIAHDFNNLLAGQRGFCELLCNSRDLSKRDHVYANEMLKITDRASKLTSRLLSFSRGRSEKPSVTNLNSTIGNLMPMLSRILSSEIDFTSELDPDLGNVKVDINQIDQVIMNLVVNGQEAINDRNGSVKLTTEMVELTGSEIFITGQCEPGKYAKVSVKDSGQGIHQELLEKIFEPFFTTKRGAGTGLGLSIVYGIIQSNGGHLMVESVIGAGTEFAFYFPEVSDAIEPEEITDHREQMPSAEAGTSGDIPTLLVAEDQDEVREILELGLGQSGYKLIVAPNGSEAIKLAAEYEGTIDLVLTDSMMPGASGCTVIQKLREQYPNIKTILVSGLPQQESAECRDIAVDAYVDKPFSIRKLLELIQSLVSAPKN